MRSRQRRLVETTVHGFGGARSCTVETVTASQPDRLHFRARTTASSTINPPARPVGLRRSSTTWSLRRQAPRTAAEDLGGKRHMAIFQRAAVFVCAHVSSPAR